MTRLPSDLDPEVEHEFLNQAEREIRQHGRRVITGIVAIGKKLAEVKKRLGHGKYEAFVRDRLGFGLDSALRFVQSFELVLKSGNLRDLEFLQIDASALYLLARPSTPEELRREVFERAKTEPVSHIDVAQAIKDAANIKTVVTTHKITLLAPTYTPEKAGDTVPQQANDSDDDANKYSWPCIPKDLKEISLNKEQDRVFKMLLKHFKNRRSQRILITMLEGEWPWMRPNVNQ